SDANDATWIADLLAHGLIRASFVPPQPIQDLRDLTRTRRGLTREIVRHTQRISGDAGGGQPQAGLGHFRHPGLERPAHLEGDRVGPKRPAAAGRTRPSPTRLHARGTRRRVGRTLARPSSLPDRSASEDDRTDRSHDRGVRRAAGGCARSLLRRRRAVERSSRRQRQRRPNRDRRDRRRYEGLPHGRPSALLGRHVSTARRKRRPKALEAPAQGRALAETRARPGGPGGDEGEKLQPQGAILQPQTAPRPQEGDHRRRRRDAAHHLPYAQRRNLLPRPRTRLPSTSKPGAHGPKPRQPNPLPRLRRRNQKGRMTSMFQERVRPAAVGRGGAVWSISSTVWFPHPALRATFSRREKGFAPSRSGGGAGDTAL